MPITRFRLPTGIFLALFAVTSPQAAPAQTDVQPTNASKPNIVVIFIDHNKR